MAFVNDSLEEERVVHKGVLKAGNTVRVSVLEKGARYNLNEYENSIVKMWECKYVKT